MTPAEAGVLLAGISKFDNRKPGTPDEADQTARMWSQALYDIRLEDAARAVTEHFATSTEYLMPAHIRRAVKQVQARRIREHPPLTPPPGPPDETEAELVARHLAWTKEAHRRIGDGEVIDCDAAYGELRSRHLPDLKALMPTVAVTHSVPADGNDHNEHQADNVTDGNDR